MGPDPIACEHSVVPALLVEDYSLPIERSLHPCSESVDYRCECISGPSVFFCWYVCP